MTSKSDSPAPPPCEHDCDCDMYHDGECFHCDSEQKDAEIAELRAAIGKPP